MTLRLACLLLLALARPVAADPAAARAAVRAETLRPYTGPVERGVDTTTLDRKLMTGYQGWFNAEGDGADRGWSHWTRDRRRPHPENIRVDLWPDLSEFGPEERFPTDFPGADGKPAALFSSFHRETVLRHFRWMRDYGLDGAFVQRFSTDLGDVRALRHNNTVLAHAREGANRHGRAWALMFDLSGLRAARFAEVVEDVRSLRAAFRLGEDPAYLHHRGKPLLAVWGVGFADQRPYSLQDCRGLIEALRGQGFALMLGVPCYWRTLDRDAAADPALLDLLAAVDVLSPWTVGRFDRPEGATRHAERTLAPDLAWCRSRGVDYLPVVFPGFSWHNMHRESRFDAIPRLGGRFLQSQIDAALGAGARMLYVAMFDETDEATAIFKASPRPPPGRPFVHDPELPSDHYLKLAGEAAARLHRLPGK
jgi:hypothetical protein